MYVILVYDVNVEYVNKVRIFLKQYLNWVQNSVFEGELTDAEYLKIMGQLEKIIKKSYGHVLCYKIRDEKFIQFDEIGIPKSEITNIL